MRSIETLVVESFTQLDPLLLEPRSFFFFLELALLLDLGGLDATGGGGGTDVGGSGIFTGAGGAESTIVRSAALWAGDNMLMKSCVIDVITSGSWEVPIRKENAS